MIIADILKLRQPQVYNALIRCFELADIEVQEREPVTYVIQPEFSEDEPLFEGYKEIMEKPRGVSV